MASRLASVHMKRRGYPYHYGSCPAEVFEGSSDYCCFGRICINVQKVLLILATLHQPYCVKQCPGAAKRILSFVTHSFHLFHSPDDNVFSIITSFHTCNICSHFQFSRSCTRPLSECGLCVSRFVYSCIHIFPRLHSVFKTEPKGRRMDCAWGPYTAGSGCNGLGERRGGDAARGQRAFPMQMSTDVDNWNFINDDRVLPRFTFSAYAGDTTVDLAIQQLTQGSFNLHSIDLPRHSMGKPQLAVVTIGEMTLSSARKFS